MLLILKGQIFIIVEEIIDDKLLQKLSNIAHTQNIELYVVGGFVRDLFLNKSVKDIDFTVVGDAIEFAQIIAKEFNSKAVIYERFRTALVPIGDYHLEFVGTRKEIYTKNSRNPNVEIGSLKDDIYRRDFTINSMAISLNKTNYGEFIDLLNGKKDLENKIIRTPFNSLDTYNEDPLRMMRCLRFASQLNFEIEEQSLKSIEILKDRIKIISQERITDEFFKILKSPCPSIGLNYLFETGLLNIIFPEVALLSGVDIISKNNIHFAHKDVFKHTLQVLDNISKETDNVWLRFVALIHDIAKPKTKKYIEGIGWTFYGHEEIGARWVKRFFRVLKLPMQHLDYVEKLVRLHQRPMSLVEDNITDSALRRLAAYAGDDLEDLLILCKADITTRSQKKVNRYLKNYEIVKQKIIEVQEKDKLREFQSPVRGELIMEICNIKPSRLVGFIKLKIEDAILEGIIPNNFEESYQYFLENKEIWINEFNSN